jgi:hypothetical protein
MQVNLLRPTLAGASAAVILFALAACGGGGSGGGSTGSQAPSTGTTTPGPTQSDFEAGVFRDAREYEALCLAPRAGTSDLQGTTEDENNWLRAWSHDLYLWYAEIMDEDPAAFETLEYFDLMQTFETTETGAPKDNFHFTQDTAAFQQLVNSGIQAEYGLDWEWIRNSPPREAVIAYVQAGTPADSVGLQRGDRILEIDGESLIDGNDADTLNAGLFPDNGSTHEFVVARADGSNQRTVTLTAVELALDPVPISRIIDTPQGPVGYLFLISYIDPAEQALFSTLSNFATAGITELVVDVRYNRGGLLSIANELSYMIAGPTATEGRTFGELIFNDKYPAARAPPCPPSTSPGSIFWSDPAQHQPTNSPSTGYAALTLKWSSSAKEPLASLMAFILQTTAAPPTFQFNFKRSMRKASATFQRALYPKRIL